MLDSYCVTWAPTPETMVISFGNGICDNLEQSMCLQRYYDVHIMGCILDYLLPAEIKIGMFE